MSGQEGQHDREARRRMRAGAFGRGSDMTRRNVTDVQCEALFASALQGSDAVTADAAAAAISGTIRRLGPDGCADRMAQEFGDHPEEARDRMRWARHLVGDLSPQSRRPGAGAVPRCRTRTPTL
jgi:hypothetical protein